MTNVTVTNIHDVMIYIKLTRRNTQYLDVSLNPNFSLTRAYAHPAEEEEEEKVVAVEKADADGETERVKEEDEEEEEQVKMQGRRGLETQREATSTGAGMRRIFLFF